MFCEFVEILPPPTAKPDRQKLFGSAVGSRRPNLGGPRSERNLSCGRGYFLTRKTMEPRILPLWRPEIEMVERMRIFLNENLLGQEDAVREVCDLFIARSVRSEDDRRPFMTVFLNGPSGVGKTMLFELV